MNHIKSRCFWVNMGNSAYVAYHDDEWGVPVACQFSRTAKQNPAIFY